MIIFSSHSLLKLKQRDISSQLVKKALKLPDHQFSSYSDRKIVYKKFNNLYLRVIYKEKRNDIFVITQHWAKRIKEKS
jgi:hypothetical protein